LLKQCIGSITSVRLRNGTKIEGKLIAYDEHVNLMLENISIQRNNIDKIEEKRLMYLRGDSVQLVGLK